MDAEIRRAREGDISGMVELERSSMEPVREDSGVESDWKNIEDFLEKRIEDDLVLVAETGEGLLGYVHAVLYDDVVSGKKVCEVYTLTIHPEHFGEGLGGELMERVKEESRRSGVDILKLEVLSKNKDAIGFYEKKGFSEKKKIMVQRLDEEKKNNL